ncbi:MAG: hypothetical protein KAI69_02230 [Deltaproteobacteria bacterium]|nr:hypothetical protein [Deltaproteobacteria bacterium]
MMLLLTVACNTKHQVAVAPIEVKPIHITIDVNIKVDRALDDFFGDLDATAGADNKTKPAINQTTK